MSQIFHDHEADQKLRVKWWTSRVAIYAALLIWAVICIFPDRKSVV